jgi:cell wall-associated NlpC family hydrolase
MADGQLNAGPIHAPIIPLGLIIIGAYLTWFGVHYWSSDTKWPTDPVKSVLQGNGVPSPQGAVTTAELAAQIETGTAGGGSAVTSSTGSAIADAALKYAGAGYVWGGPADRAGNWDCSSFVSYVLGHDLSMTLPGGGRYGEPGYPPNAHGPTTLQYLLWGMPLNQDQVRAGDLIVSTEHMGIAISGTQMISAQDPALGTGTGGFTAGFPGGPPVYRRVSRG